ncbi:MAG TPA: hypothetical protein VJT09_11010 [Pyrinomonadaceae bacterium]|nr:hypothetical protein [Pyrinomonadaceae bacterium]
MDELLRPWPLLVIPAVLYCVIIVAGSMKLAATYKSLGGKIASNEDLAVMKKAINLNMMIAIFIFVYFAAYIALMFYLTFNGRVSLITAAIYVPLVTSAGLACSLLYAKKIEKKAKNMTITTEDPQILQTYWRWVKQWDEPRLKLPD